MVGCITSKQMSINSVGNNRRLNTSDFNSLVRNLNLFLFLYNVVIVILQYRMHIQVLPSVIYNNCFITDIMHYKIYDF